MIIIKQYKEKDKKDWNKFLSTSNNGTIFQNKTFLDYHITRSFNDYSLIIKKQNKIIALLPAAIIKKRNNLFLHSHPGASYGGLVTKPRTTFTQLNDIINALDKYCLKHKFSSLLLINTPNIYNININNNLDYLLHWNGYKQTELYISHIIYLNLVTKLEGLLNKRKQRYLSKIKKSQKYKFKLSNQFKEFYPILLKSKKRHKTIPTHTLEELIKLKKLLPDKIQLYLTYYNNNIIGGSLLFFANKNVSLVFYNVVLNKYKNTQLSMFQLFKCMELSKQLGYNILDLGVSHNPEKKNPLSPKISLIQFKEQLGAQGVLRKVYKKEYNFE